MPSASELWSAGAPLGELHSLRAEASVDQQGPEGRIKGRVLMFMQRPDHVRFDAMTQFGPIAILTSNGTTFALSELKEKRFIEGPSCPANIGRMLGVEMTAAQVLGLLLGELPGLEAPSETTRCEEGHLIVKRQDAEGGAFRASFVQEPGTPARLVGVEQRDAGGRLLWDVEYEDYAQAGGFKLPQVVRLRDHRNETTLLVRFKEVAVNVDVPADAFEQSPRPGLVHERVGCR